MKNALVPVSYADKLGLATGVGEKGNRTPHDTGRPVKKVDKLWVAKLLKKNQHFANLPVSRNGENKLGGKAKSIARFLVDAYKLSDEQGYLTIGDLTSIAGLSSVNYGAGTKELSTIIAMLCLADCVTVAGRGRTASEMNEETDFGVDDVELNDVDNIDLADFC
jgi:ribosome biogenesis protein Tsr3